VGEVVKGCPSKWVQWEQRMQGFTCGCLCRRRAAPVLDANLSKPMPLFFYSLLLFLQEANQGTLPWRGDQW
jgi:hypothetical protein